MMINKKNQHELLRFLVTGMMAVGSDLISYYLLLNYISVDMAKGASFIIGSVVAFFMNKIWTFKSDAPTHSAALSFSILYCFTFIANVSVNHLTLLTFENLTLLGFLFATSVSTVLNYIGMKFWVFKPQISEQG